jgi:hypothetical protein
MVRVGLLCWIIGSAHVTSTQAFILVGGIKRFFLLYFFEIRMRAFQEHSVFSLHSAALSSRPFGTVSYIQEYPSSSVKTRLGRHLCLFFLF